jgi:tyrosyl-tRNA synthetase
MPGTGPAEGGLARLLVDAGAAASNREAREFLQAGSVQVNGARIGPDTSVADVMARAIGGHLLIRRGKKSWHAVRVRS